jgi:hypothetical protein
MLNITIVLALLLIGSFLLMRFGNDTVGTVGLGGFFISFILIIIHSANVLTMDRDYESLRVEGEVIQATLDNVRGSDNLMENTAVSGRVIDYNLI